MGDINTKVTGKPEDLRATASWLRTSLGREVREAAQVIATARNTAEAAWDGAAGDAFAAKMLTAAKQGNALADLLDTSAAKFDDLAVKLQHAQTHMHNVRAEAARAGLEVVGDIIRDAAAAGTDAKRVAAFRTAQAGAAIGRQLAQTFLDTAKNMLDDWLKKWGFIIGDLVAGIAGEKVPPVAAARAPVLAARAANLTQIAGQLDAQRAQFAPGAHTTLSEHMRYSAQELRADAAQLRRGAAAWRLGGAAAKAGGPVVASAAVAYDIHNGKDPAKAVASGVAGAVVGGVVTGALVGSSVPLFGTVAGGVLGGVGAGVATSGLVDAIWDEANVGSKVTNAIGDGFKLTGSSMGRITRGFRLLG